MYGKRPLNAFLFPSPGLLSSVTSSISASSCDGFPGNFLSSLDIHKSTYSKNVKIQYVSQISFKIGRHLWNMFILCNVGAIFFVLLLFEISNNFITVQGSQGQSGRETFVPPLEMCKCTLDSPLSGTPPMWPHTKNYIWGVLNPTGVFKSVLT